MNAERINDNIDIKRINKVCVIVPIYKPMFNENESKAMTRGLNILSDRACYFMAPKSLDTSYYKANFPNVDIVRYSDRYFKNTAAYSKLLISRNFYLGWKEYEYMLILQPDVYILKDEDLLDEFIKADFDYWGAPWKTEMKLYPVCLPMGEKLVNRFLPYNKSFVGNGGFSLRRISTMASITSKHRLAAIASGFCNYMNEDVLLCYYLVKDGYHLPSIEQAQQFSVEETAKDVLNENILPYAIHAYEKYYGSIQELELAKSKIEREK